MHGGDSFRAERALGDKVRRDVEAPERVKRDIEACGPARSVDEDRSPCHGPARRADRIDRLLDRSARRHDVVDDEHRLARVDRGSATKLAARPPFAPLGVDRAQAELPRDLVRQDDAGCRGAGDRLHLERPRPDGDRRAEPRGLRGVLQDLELLQIQRGVSARREDEVSLAERARLAKDALDIRRCDGHHDYSARR